MKTFGIIGIIVGLIYVAAGVFGSVTLATGAGVMLLIAGVFLLAVSTDLE